MAHPQCAACPQAHNSINGRYCRIIKRYVEYDRVPPCMKSKNKIANGHNSIDNRAAQEADERFS